MIDSNLLIVLNGYYYADELDDFNLNSLKSQSSKNFSILFIDPWISDTRKNKINQFQKDTKIQCLYLPYQRDFRPRKYDWTTRNIASMIMNREGRFFNYWQNRIINKNLVKFIEENEKSNIGFARIWLNNQCKYPFNNDQEILYNIDKYVFLNSKTSCFESDEEIVNIDNKYINYSFYDICVFVEDFLKLNGTDEALTSWLYEEDWDIETRWKVAADMDLIKNVIISSSQMMYFPRESRKYISIFPVSEYVDDVKYKYHCRNCYNCSENFLKVNSQVNIVKDKNIDNLEYIGIINNYIEWFKCKICGQLWPVVGDNGFDNIYNSAIKNRIYRASIGIDGNYGRNLVKIRKDIFSVSDWKQKIEIINNSWKNKEYYQEN